MSFNEQDECLTVLPKHLSEEYFNDILTEKYENYVITKFSVKKALEVGENFSSTMYRCTIEVKLSGGIMKNLSYIIKGEPEVIEIRDLIDDMGFFVKEIQMYEKYIPKFENLYQKFGVNIKFAPKQYKLTPDVLVMEDLNKKGYENLNRQEGFDLKQSEAILAKLAKFHAASVCIYEEDGPYPENFLEGFYTGRLLETFKLLHYRIPEILIDCMQKWGTCNKYIDKMKIVIPESHMLASKVLKYNPNAFNVLNHGDLWINNIMFKYDDISDKLDDIQFVDLQLCKWGSPAHDLNYFIISSCSTEIKVKYFDYLIKYYHDQLISNLILLKYPKPLPKYSDLRCEVIKCGYFALATSVTIMSMALLDPSENATLTNLLDTSDAGLNLKRQLYLNPRYIEDMEKLLPFFDNRGFLDF